MVDTGVGTAYKKSEERMDVDFFATNLLRRKIDSPGVKLMKVKVLDTNVLMDRLFESVLESFTEPTRVIIPYEVLKELDKYKKGFEARNEYARAAIRLLDELRQKGKLHQGVSYGQHIIEVSVKTEDLDLDNPDNKIIKVAMERDATLVSQDINERVVADALGVEAIDFAPNTVDVNRLYTGYREIEITEEEAIELMDYHCEGIDAGDRDLMGNEFVIMTSPLGATYLGIYKKQRHRIEKLKTHYQAWGIKPKKDGKGDPILEQVFLMHLLLDPEIHFVTAVGPSGCGKTLLTLAAALEQTINGNSRGEGYARITVMRPLIPVGEDIGFLPGDKLEKLEPWMASTFDALDYLLDEYQPKDGSFLMSTKDKIYRLIEQGVLDLQAMAHIRGRSIPNQFIIVDDAQNLTQHQAATIITRAGEGSKLVFLGDLSEKQIDNHRLTPSSNGLAYVIDRMKGEDIVGHITLQTVVRSKLAQLGVEKL